MINRFKKILAVILTICTMLSACSLGMFCITTKAETVGYYTYTVSNGKATVTDVSTLISGDYTVPPKLGGYPVTAIANYAFFKCDNLTSITIPNSVTNIGDYAFSKCDSLTSVTLPNSVISIGNYTFSFCQSLTSIILPDSITSIGSHVFNYCTSLASITLPDNIINISDYAFYECTSLKNITLPDSVTNIGDYAFYKCTSLRNITIPDGVTRIGRYMFYNCTSLTSVDIPDSVTSIGESAFDYCTSLTDITIPNSVTYISNAFHGCTRLECITVPFVGESRNSKSVGAVFGAIFGFTTATNPMTGDPVRQYIIDADKYYYYYIPSSLKVVAFTDTTHIPAGAFYNCSNLTIITLCDDITSIGDLAFMGCTSLTSVYISDIAMWCNIDFISSDLNSIRYSNPLSYADYLYLNGELVKDLVIPNGVTTISNYAFYNYQELTSVTIPESVSSISDSAFQNCRYITSFNVSENNAYFCDIDGVLFNKDKTILLKYPIGQTDTTYTIPDSVISISGYAFEGCSNLRNIEIPNSVKRINDSSFKDCNRLLNVYYGGSKSEAEFNCFDENEPLNTATWHYNSCIKHTYTNDCDMSCNNCGATRAITHSYKTTWSCDNSSHYYECLVCGTKKDIESHKYDNDCDKTCNTCGCIRAVGAHSYYNACDTNCNICGKLREITHNFVDGICSVCGEKKFTPGDIDNTGGVTDADAEYLLMFTFFPEDYPVNQTCDFNGDGYVNDADAEHLLMFTFFPEDYPLH